jgi:hypothetical protein
MKNQLCFRLIKMVDIIYISALAVIFGFILAYISDGIFGSFNKEKYDKEIKDKKDIRAELAIKMVIVVSYTSIILYLLRNFIELIPSPFNGICGLQHVRVKEIETVTGIIFVLFFSYQFDFLEYIRERYVKKIYQ